MLNRPSCHKRLGCEARLEVEALWWATLRITRCFNHSPPTVKQNSVKKTPNLTIHRRDFVRASREERCIKFLHKYTKRVLLDFYAHPGSLPLQNDQPRDHRRADGEGAVGERHSLSEPCGVKEGAPSQIHPILAIAPKNLSLNAPVPPTHEF